MVRTHHERGGALGLSASQGVPGPGYPVSYPQPLTHTLVRIGVAGAAWEQRSVFQMGRIQLQAEYNLYEFILTYSQNPC